MNLLTEPWIPVRPLPTGAASKLTLHQLLCEDGRWELCLPRDDMELAGLQLLICMAQVFFPPKDIGELKQRIMVHLPAETFERGCVPYRDWFQLDHPNYPFMQVRGVNAKKTTPMDKLLAGLSGATNSCFVNEPGLGDCLCGGCAAIALFNQASNAPSFGGGAEGGFKAGLRGAAPITTLVQGEHLRQTIWFNILTAERLVESLPWYQQMRDQKPTWVTPIVKGEKISVQKIGLLRGLLWQPAHIELIPPVRDQVCACCGFRERGVFQAFNKEQFGFSIDGLWPHPHGPRISTVKKGKREEKFTSFTTSAPAWTQLSRFVVQRQTDGKAEGQEPAAVVRQAQGLIRGLRLNVGGYRNNQASILERRHQLIFIRDGWSDKTNIVDEIVSLGTGYRDAIYKSLSVFVKGIKQKKIKGAGIEINKIAEEQFYRRSEDTVLDTLANIDFGNPASQLQVMQNNLHRIAVDLFDESVHPYQGDPELIRTTAVARKTLHKHLNVLKPQQDERRDDGTKG